MLHHTVTTTNVGELPIAGAEMLTHLRLDVCDDVEATEFDTIHLPEAIGWLESELRVEIQTKTVVEELELAPCWDAFRLSRSPVTEVTAMEVYDAEAAAFVDLDDTKYETAYKPGQVAYVRRICGADCSCCLCAMECPDRVRVTYAVGFTTETLPAKYKRAIKWMAAHLWTFREPVTEGRVSEIPLGLQRLTAMLKKRRVIA